MSIQNHYELPGPNVLMSHNGANSVSAILSAVVLVTVRLRRFSGYGQFVLPIRLCAAMLALLRHLDCVLGT